MIYDFENKSLKSKHALDVNFGEEGFINGVPFMHHAGRGAARHESYVKAWVDKVNKYLNNGGNK